MNRKILTRDEILSALQNITALPEPRRGHKHRTIYEAGEGQNLRASGHFFIDYPTFPGGISGEVPPSIISSLEDEGVIVRAFPDKPEIKAWMLKI